MRKNQFLIVSILLLLGIIFCAPGPRAQSKKLFDGTYKAKSQGHVGDVAVEATVKAGWIKKVEVVEHMEYEHKDAIAKT